MLADLGCAWPPINAPRVYKALQLGKTAINLVLQALQLNSSPLQLASSNLQ